MYLEMYSRCFAGLNSAHICAALFLVAVGFGFAVVRALVADVDGRRAVTEGDDVDVVRSVLEGV